METGHKILTGALSVLTLCIGLYLLIYESREISKMIDTVRDQIKTDVMYQQYSERDLDEVSYAQMVSMLMSELEYDIEIDGMVVRSVEHANDKIQNYNLTIGSYRKQYQYDESGTITLIVYTGENGVNFKNR